MRIEQLNLKNYRGFEEITIDFPKDNNVVVLLGTNGSGKTSILDAIASHFYEILRDKIKDNYNVESQSAYEFSVENINKYWLGRDRKMSIETQLNGYIDIITLQGMNNLLDIKREVLLYRMHHGKMRDFGLFCAYNAKRFVELELNHIISKLGEQKEETIKKPISPFKFDRGVQGFYDLFFDFYRKFSVEDREKIKRKDFNYKLPSLQTMRDSLELFFNVFDSDFSELRIEYNLLNDNPLGIGIDIPYLVINKNSESIDLNLLSDGEKNLIVLVADIARRLNIINPNLENPLHGKGIVLIDEIELHLHPGWQRKVLPALTATFPNIQFIVTTHSPQVVGSLKKESIRMLENFKLVGEISPVYGEDSNTILWEIFGVKKQAEHAEKAFNKFYRLLEDNKEGANKMLEALEEVYGYEHSAVKQARLDYDFEVREYMEGE